ncbi:PIN domain-containing protein [Pseudodesulfovibrio tunisiensis]|uniref:PIN domain-containing protein n=1 Tax=Pseudodesulfovibrio tunisiensis TaxID=463192 RepID=UPI001FB1EB72|nr:PIN domain-containing protein [Pseudodesulfovibrio tunisiensis]
MKAVFDTTFFFEQKFDWKSRKNLLLQQLHADGLIEVYIPEVVDREIQNHLTQQAKKAFASIKKQFDNTPAIAVSNLEPIKAMVIFFQSRESKNSLISRVIEEYEEFKQLLDVTIIPLACERSTNVFNDYFSLKPPFENKEQKKNEFPDAFAIESTKAFFDEEYHVISRDKGWQKAFKDEKKCTFFLESGPFFSHIEKMLVEAARLRKAHAVIEQHFSPIRELFEERFPNHGFMATDVPDEYVDSVEVNQVDLINFFIEEADDEYIIFSADSLITYTANISYSDPDSWYKDDETKEVFYWEKVENDEVVNEIQVGGRFTYALNPDSGEFEGLIDWETDIPDTIYFEVQNHDCF